MPSSFQATSATWPLIVNHFVGLVYSTALRLVGGDTHQAEDVTQTVFVDLARQARTLPAEARLGGWLHRHTCFVAANTLRGERRRQARERQAVEMNALQNHPEADFSQVAPLLDEAINELADADRTAILLRFFEQQDFRAVNQALASAKLSGNSSGYYAAPRSSRPRKGLNVIDAVACGRCNRRGFSRLITTMRFPKYEN